MIQKSFCIQTPYDPGGKWIEEAPGTAASVYYAQSHPSGVPEDPSFSVPLLLSNSLPSPAAQIPWLFLLSVNKYVPGIVQKNNVEWKQWWALPSGAYVGWERQALHSALILPTPIRSQVWMQGNALGRPMLTFARFRARVQMEAHLHMSKYYTLQMKLTNMFYSSILTFRTSERPDLNWGF